MTSSILLKKPPGAPGLFFRLGLAGGAARRWRRRSERPSNCHCTRSPASTSKAAARATSQSKCLGKNQPHRTVVVGEHHSALQARRQEQQTKPFKERMKHRNGIEGTQSELVRGHGLRRARYRGLPKVRLQNYFIGAACNVKRWLRRQAWEMRQAMAAAAAEAASAAAL